MWANARRSDPPIRQTPTSNPRVGGSGGGGQKKKSSVDRTADAVGDLNLRQQTTQRRRKVLCEFVVQDCTELAKVVSRRASRQ
jgi:hypothetical protein